VVNGLAVGVLTKVSFCTLVNSWVSRLQNRVIIILYVMLMFLQDLWSSELRFEVDVNCIQ
jgi:hypothetical protein